MANLAFLRKSLLKHVISAHRMTAYCRRFPTDLTVIT
jgi:hypothetical protein